MGDPLPIVGCICWEYVSTYKFCTLEKKGTCRLSWQGGSHGYLREWVWQTLLMLTNISKSLPFPFSMNELIPIMWPVLTSGVWPEMTCEHFRVGVHFSPCFFFFFFFLFSLSLSLENPEVVMSQSGGTYICLGPRVTAWSRVPWPTALSM